ncbi:hypothetical protein HNQ77_000922 [Silvibacterium bohemicum]|uniref:Uncharacterized protein n=1 Tax=Silvibacterium bohemicum TaxID=1577686 RepID=A0A841JX12_9BACT|nr:hypothetical protein [Silvibacterium bohemicum]MBB6142978.1 hypothetical protein [Silvibacterium bohemicum]
MERTPDLVAKIRAMREAADKLMNRFTRVADYDVRRVVGQLPKAPPVSDETVLPSPPPSRQKKSSTKSANTQTAIDFTPAPAERGDDGEAA